MSTTASARDQLIRDLYPTASRTTLLALAAGWNWTERQLRHQAHVLGVRRDPEASSTSHAEATRKVMAQRSEDALIAPPFVLEGDRKYWRTCLAHGGFVRAVRVGNSSVWVRPEGARA